MFFGDPYAGFVSALLLIDDVEKEKEFILGYNEVSPNPLEFNSHTRVRMALYKLYFDIITTIETYRYGMGSGKLVRAYLRGDIKKQLRNLKAGD